MLSQSEIDSYGIIYTPLNFVEKVLEIIPNHFFKNPIKCLDIGSGTGNFSKVLFKNILNNTQVKREKKESEEKFNIRKSLIALKSITMIDINEKHIEILRESFGKDANIIKCDFLNNDDNFFLSQQNNKFDLIIGNPPYNINGKIKTPTNNNIIKKNDGITVYPKFVEKALDLLNDDGLLCFIIPIIWLKPDKYNLYYLLTGYKILKLHILNNFESNKLFNYKCQTPTCYFLLQKTKNDIIKNDNKNIEDTYKILNIFDKFERKYVEYKLCNNLPIPIHGISIINKFIEKTRSYGNLKIIKTNLPSKNVMISNIKSEIYCFENIKSCNKKREKKNQKLDNNILNNNISNNISNHDISNTFDNELHIFHNDYELVINYSNKELIYYKVPKLIMAHKVYGIPHLDLSGNYGISTRDNYIIKDYKINELEFLKYFFESKTIMFIFSTTRYRMQYLEKYCFEFIPDILKYCREKKINLNKIKKNIDNFLFSEFELTENEILTINKNYIL